VFNRWLTVSKLWSYQLFNSSQLLATFMLLTNNFGSSQ
jgi:hypothetical protein